MVALCALFLDILMDLTYRFFFHGSINGVVEIGEILMVAIAFLALGYGQLIGAHVKMEYFGNMLYKRQKPYVEVFTTLVVIAFFGMMTLQMGKRAYFDWSDKVLLSNSTVPLPTWWVSAIATAGAGVLVLCLLAQLIEMVTRLVGNYSDHRQLVKDGG